MVIVMQLCHSKNNLLSLSGLGFEMGQGGLWSG